MQSYDINSLILSIPSLTRTGKNYVKLIKQKKRCKQTMHNQWPSKVVLFLFFFRHPANYHLLTTLALHFTWPENSAKKKAVVSWQLSPSH